MVERGKKTRLELSDLVMAEIRKDGGETVPFAIVPAAQLTPNHANWDVDFIKTTTHVAPPTGVFKLIAELKNEFDCIWPG